MVKLETLDKSLDKAYDFMLLIQWEIENKLKDRELMDWDGNLVPGTYSMKDEDFLKLYKTVNEVCDKLYDAMILA